MLIAELVPGAKFNHCIYQKKKVEVKTAKNGAYLQLELSDASGRKTMKKWQATEEDIFVARRSKFLLVSGCVEEHGQYKSDVRITTLAAAEEPQFLDGFLTPFANDHPDHISRFERLSLSVREPNLRRLLDKVFDKEKEIWPLYCRAYAAAKKHHAYPGGLLHHSVEVAELCASAAEIMPTLSRDLLVTCALLHDIGKLNEMDHHLHAGEYLAAGVLNGHISLGSSRIRQVMNSLKEFPSLLKEAVTHMILSHHGVLEFGSPVVPKFAEAQVLAQCDLISARVFEYSKAVSSAQGELSVWLSGKENIQVYTGDLGLQPAEVSAERPDAVQAFMTTAGKQPPNFSEFRTKRMSIKALVAAGSPEQGSADQDEEVRDVIPPACGADYLVRVTGDSMADEGIREHDLLFVKSIEAPRDGDIVIAHMGVSGEVVKRFRHDAAKTTGQERKWLESENAGKNYPCLPIDHDTRIRGKVVGLLRDM